ncbi:MAG TPA: methionine--tRNA ligase [Holophagaceae bacterium]|nr:methionine--tRNA ligase [Holophagaceae bacterium]
MPKPFYLTTPIYYVNDRPHIGHVYTTVLADAIARFHRQMGETVYFLTGTDEHGQKVEKAATARGIAPKALADEVVANYTDLWKRMDMTHFRFIRTTDADHRKVVQERFKQLLETGDIYKATYKGLYSVSDEAFVTETQAKELQAQGLAHQLIELEEETYFFRLSKYEKPLLAWYAAHPEFVQPDFRFNEVRRFVEGGLQDLSISRTTINWGIPVPGDEKHVVYVWFDALLNYLTGAPDGAWPPDLQIVGKDILRFHAVYWPAFLMAMGLDLPKTILAHGWWLMGNDKMSKSKGNVVRPDTLMKFGNDALRFYFLRDMQVGHDRDFSFEGFIDRLNADLANGLGNLASRSISMIQRYRGSVVPAPEVFDADDAVVAEQQKRLVADFIARAGVDDFHGALGVLWAQLRFLDGYIVKAEPWKLAKDQANKAKLDTVLAQLYRALRAAAALLGPVTPEMAQILWESLGCAGKVADQNLAAFAMDAPVVAPVAEPKPLFQRIDKEKEMSELESANAAPAPAAPSLDVPEIREMVDADTFFKVDLRVGRILEAERVPKSDKLIKMKVDIGLEQRTIVGGIGKAYEPAELLQRLVVVVANLAPRKLMGIESHGMLLAASDSGSKPYLIAPPADALPGFIVK